VTFETQELKLNSTVQTTTWCFGDLRIVDSFYAPDGQICIGLGDVSKGDAVITETAADLIAGFPDLKFVTTIFGVREITQQTLGHPNVTLLKRGTM